MFLSYYGLEDQPFGVTPDPRFLYQGEVHREALASLLYAVESGLGFSSLIAEPGTGKTTLLYYLLQYYRDCASTAFLFDQQCDSRQLLRNLLVEFEIDASESDAVALSNRLREFLLQQRRARRRVLVVLDEAQNFSDAVLETVRLLSNFETPGAKLLHIILSGQPQLAAKLLQPELLNVRQRISMATRLRPFAPLDVARYIAHRLKVAGFAGGELFTADALAAVAQFSGGVPREINRICFNALSIGCALQLSEIPPSVVEEATRDFDFASLLSADVTREHNANSPGDFAEAFAAEFTSAHVAGMPSDTISVTIPNIAVGIPAPNQTPAVPAAVAGMHQGAATCPVLETSHDQGPSPDRGTSHRWRWWAVPAAAVLAVAAIGMRLDSNHAATTIVSAAQPRTVVAQPVAAPVKSIGTSEIEPKAPTTSEPQRRHRRTLRGSHSHAKSSGHITRASHSLIAESHDVRAGRTNTAAPTSDPISDDEISGEVVMNAAIDKYGHVQSVEQIAGPESLREAAANKIRQWIFQPRLVDGEPQPMQVRVRVWVTR